jgi:hypothetical protein
MAGQNYIPVQQTMITSNTQELLLRRPDDYRVRFADHVLFSDSLRNTIQKSQGGYSLRKARTGDVLSYEFVEDYELMRALIEQNISNIAKLKAQRQLDLLRRVWIIAYDISEEEADKENGKTNIVVYADPVAADINTIIKEKRIILGLFFIVEFDSIETKKNPKLESDRIEWMFMSPGDLNNLEEYNEYLRKKEAESLSGLFYIDFNKQLEEVKDGKVKTAQRQAG